MITSLGLKTILRSKKIKKARYAITNVSMKDISKIIKEFERFPYKGYVRESSCMTRLSSHAFKQSTKTIQRVINGTERKQAQNKFNR